MKYALTSVVAAALAVAAGAAPGALAAGNDQRELVQAAVAGNGEFLAATSWQFATSDEVMAQLLLDMNQVDVPGDMGDQSSQIEYGELGW
jgi:hypothetical protein